MKEELQADTDAAYPKLAMLLRTPSGVAVAYLVVGWAWLWLSSELVSRLAFDIAELETLEKIKGALFMAVTATLLYAWLRCVRRLETRLPQVENQLHDSESQFARVLEFSPDAIIIHDARRILHANPAFFKLLDLPPDADVSAITLRDVIAPAYLPTISERVRRLASEVGTAAPIEVKFRTPSGKQVEAEHASCSVLVGGHIVVQSHLRDLTERNHAWRELQQWNEQLDARVRERTAELAAANKTLESFTYSVAHDLRSPVGRISGFASALVDCTERQDFAKMKHYALRVVANAKSMGEMIDGMLLLSRADRAALKLGLIDTNALVRGYVTELEARSAHIVIDGDLPDCVGDPSLVREVWANLISNGLKYSAAAPTPRIVLSGTENEGGCQYCVADNGIGFDESESGNLFRTFHRLGNAQEFAGTGVGLSIVKRIVTRHGGRVWANGRPNEGAKFYFTLPRPNSCANLADQHGAQEARLA